MKTKDNNGAETMDNNRTEVMDNNGDEAMNNNNHNQHYNQDEFWSKLGSVARIIPFRRNLLAMYFCLIDDDTPGWVKGLIVSALGYFIFPLDAIPDFAPFVGYLDDAGVIAAAFAVIAAHIKPEHWQKADEVLRSWGL